MISRKHWQRQVAWFSVVMLVLALVAIVAGASPHKALAASPTTINAESGTWVGEATSESTTNNCTSATTHLRYGTGTRRRALHAFNVTGAVPPGNTLTGATLKLYS